MSEEGIFDTNGQSNYVFKEKSYSGRRSDGINVIGRARNRQRHLFFLIERRS